MNWPNLHILKLSDSEIKLLITGLETLLSVAEDTELDSKNPEEAAQWRDILAKLRSLPDEYQTSPESRLA